MSADEVGARFVPAGGHGVEELTGFLRGSRDVSKHDFDALAVVLNDMLAEAGFARSVPDSEGRAPTSASPAGSERSAPASTRTR